MTKEQYTQEVNAINEFHSKELTSCNVLITHVGSTGVRGGDWGHGSRAVIKFNNSGSPMVIKIGDQLFETEDLEILIGGDTELETFKKAFGFISKYLKLEGGE